MPRLLRKDTKLTSKRMSKFLKAAGITLKQYRDWLGCPAQHSLLCWFKMNPSKSPSDWSRLVVEEKERVIA